MISLETKIIIDLDETLTTFDNGHSKNPKPKNLLTLAEEKTGYSVSSKFIKIPKYKIKKILENGF